MIIQQKPRHPIVDLTNPLARQLYIASPIIDTDTSTVRNLARPSFDGTLNGGLVPTSGALGYTLSFDGVNDYVDYGQQLWSRFDGSWPQHCVMIFILKWTDTAVKNVIGVAWSPDPFRCTVQIINNIGVNNSGTVINPSIGDLLFSWQTNSDTRLSQFGTIGLGLNDGKWHIVEFWMRDANSLLAECWIDFNQVRINNVTGNTGTLTWISSPVQDFTLGALNFFGTKSDFFVGDIADFRIAGKEVALRGRPYGLDPWEVYKLQIDTPIISQMILPGPGKGKGGSSGKGGGRGPNPGRGKKVNMGRASNTAWPLSRITNV